MEPFLESLSKQAKMLLSKVIRKGGLIFFANFSSMVKRFLSFSVFALLVACLGSVFVACSDDDSEVEYLFNREVSELTVLRECASSADSGAFCYQVRYQYPIDKDDLSKIYLWFDSTVVKDSTRSVGSKELDRADTVIEYKKTKALYDTVDLTGSDILESVRESKRESLMVAIYCEYTSGGPGSVQHVYIHFRDDIAPLFSVLDRPETKWTTGAEFKWTRPTDQTDYYDPNDLSGVIAGYNIIIYAENQDEDLSKIKVTVKSPDGVDSTGKEIYKRNAHFFSNGDSLWEESVEVRKSNKNRLHLLIKDGKGYNADEPDSNIFSLVIEGLKAESKYKIASTAFDANAQYAGNDYMSESSWHDFSTTDSIAPLMPTKIFTLKDTLFPNMARLDSNNRLRIFWSRSVDPLKEDHNIDVDSVLTLPKDCLMLLCYDTVETYEIETFNKSANKWERHECPDDTCQYNKLYQIDGDSVQIVADEVSAKGVSAFVTDTIRWVSPGDTLILRIRAVDRSGYSSIALVDTVVVSPGELASQVECPEGFIAVKASDTTGVFCMERYEHRNDSGEFMVNVLHSEALEACSSISASGFTVSLCKERDWELVCLSGGSLSYGVVEDASDGVVDYLYSYCNVATNDSLSAASIATRSSRCVNPMGVFDLPGQYQEWVLGRSEDTSVVVRGSSYKKMGGVDLESQALCTNRSFPYYTRPGYTTDSVFLYREGTRVDTVYTADTSRTLYKILTKKDFKDSLQFFDVQDSNGNSVGVDYAPYGEYKKGGEKWLETLGGSLKYVPDHIEVVFLTGKKTMYREASAFYKSSSIGFRCCAYPE